MLLIRHLRVATLAAPTPGMRCVARGVRASRESSSAVVIGMELRMQSFLHLNLQDPAQRRSCGERTGETHTRTPTTINALAGGEG